MYRQFYGARHSPCLPISLLNKIPGENQHLPTGVQTNWSTFKANATLLDQNTHRCEYSQALLIQNYQIVPPNCNINRPHWSISIVKIVTLNKKRLTQNVPTKAHATSSWAVHSVDSFLTLIRKISNAISGAANSGNFTPKNILLGDTGYWDVRHFSIPEIVRSLYIASYLSLQTFSVFSTKEHCYRRMWWTTFPNRSTTHCT